MLADARAVDELKASGHDTGPLCGLAFAVKDNIDVVGYPTVAGTPALSGALPTHVICHQYMLMFALRLSNKCQPCMFKADAIATFAEATVVHIDLVLLYHT